MPKKKQPPLSPEEQRKRFEALARESGARISKEQFRRIVGKIAVSPKRSPKLK